MKPYIFILLFVPLLFFGTNTIAQININDTDIGLVFNHFITKKQKTKSDYLSFANSIVHSNDNFFAEVLRTYIGDIADSQKVDFYNLMIYSVGDTNTINYFISTICDYYYAGGTSNFDKRTLKRKLDHVFYFENKKPDLKKTIEHMKSSILECYFR